MIASTMEVIGGIEQYNRNVVAGLREAGVDLRVVESMGIRLVQKVSFALRVLFGALRFRPDLIWCAHLNHSPIAHLLKNVLGTRYVVPLYGIDAIRISGFDHARALEAADLLTPIAHHTASNLLSQLPSLADKVFIIPNSVDGERYTIREPSPAIVAKHGLGKRRAILTVARLTPDEAKGYHCVIEALPEVVRKAPDAVYLVVGRGSDPRVARALEASGMRDHVILTGAVPAEDLLDYYNLCRAYVMPSKHEGFAIVFLEALACGRPVVASDGYGCREALFDGDLGILVNPDDRGEIASAILRLLDDPPARLGDREDLRRRTLAHYDITAFKKRVGRAVELAMRPLEARVPFDRDTGEPRVS